MSTKTDGGGKNGGDEGQVGAGMGNTYFFLGQW